MISDAQKEMITIKEGDVSSIGNQRDFRLGAIVLLLQTGVLCAGTTLSEKRLRPLDLPLGVQL
jgi:hypothetical protein